ncbi:MAG: MaoC family dehydratase [Dehalococcoidia bacterium]
MREVAFEELDGIIGEQLGWSDWVTVDQDRINAFADATGDHQWIHVDVERARDSALGTTIAHGYLTVSLLPLLVRQVWSVSGLRMMLNYGLNRCRFPSPLPAGSRVRAGATLADVQVESDGSKRVLLDVTVEREGSDKPVCVAQTVGRYYPAED